MVNRPTLDPWMDVVGLAFLTISFLVVGRLRNRRRDATLFLVQQRPLLSFFFMGKALSNEHHNNVTDKKFVASCLDHTATSGVGGEPRPLERALQHMLMQRGCQEGTISCCTHPLPSLPLVSWQGGRQGGVVGWFGT